MGTAMDNEAALAAFVGKAEKEGRVISTPLEQAIASDARAASTLTPSLVESRIVDAKWYVPDSFGGMMCIVTLDNGHTVRGESSCPDSESAQGLAYTDALNHIWELLRFAECEVAWRAAQAEGAHT
jgi:hypothetical protein